MPPRLELPPQFVAVLARLRRLIRTYVVLEGLGRVVILLFALVWLSLGLDLLWFLVSRLELPLWLRTSLSVVALGVVAAAAFSWLVWRLLPRMRARSLALVLEKRFPELDDRLITTVEMAENPDTATTPLSVSMLERTADQAARRLPDLHLLSVFREGRLIATAAAAAVLLLVTGAVFAVEPVRNHWYDAWIGRLESYWKRDTELIVRALVPPTDDPRPFRDHLYKHPIGGDLTLLVEVPEGTRPNGQPWKVPDRVQLHYVMDRGRGSGTVTLSKFGDRQFRHSIPNQIESLSFWVTGGDYTNRVPYRVEAVEPPHIDQIVLDSDFPEHTGLNETGRTQQKVQGTQISIPLETRFVLRGAINKPLQNVRIEFGDKRLAFGWFPESATARRDAAEPPPRAFRASLIEQQEGANPTTTDLSRAAGSFLAADRRSFAIPMILTAGETAAAAERAARPLDGRLSGFGVPFVLSPDTPLRIYLEDADDIVSAEPSRLTINATLDQPPVVETELQGIGSSITRKALIPVKGLLIDDYGLKEARFQFRIGDEDEWQGREFKTPLKKDPAAADPREYRLAQTPENPVEPFDVLPLDLPIGKKLTLTVFAADGDTLNGPHHSRGEQYTFTIVSNEEFLTILYGREVNLRQRFKQIMEEVDGTRKDLILHRAKYQEWTELKAENKPEDRQKIADLETAVIVCAERSLHQVRKNASETASIEDSFRSLLEELVNNRVHTEQMVQRINGLIVAPLHAIVEIDFPTVDGSIGLFKLANEKRQSPLGQIDNSVEQITTMLEHMEKVLKEMQDLAEFHEAIKELKLIIDDSEKVRQETDKEKKRELIEKLKDTKNKLDDLK